MQIRPLYDRVVLRRIEPETTSAGGIVIPDAAGKKPNRGKVVATGPGTLLDNGHLKPLTVQPGDLVLFTEYAPTEIKLNGETLLVLRESDILGIIGQSEKMEKAA